MIRTLGLAVLGLALLGAAAPPTAGVPPESCVSAQCHADVKRHQVVHGPVNVNACNACHTLTDAATHRYELAREPAELCSFCHVVDTEGMAVVHAPLTRGDCTGCHDPHGGFDRNFLRARSMGELCQSCHQSVTAGKSAVHGPVAAGACGACHQPHASMNENLLVATGRSLCVSCHLEMDEQLRRVQVVHEPVKSDCTQCHNAHASDHAMMVRAEPAKLCTSGCHEDVRQAVFEASHQHAAVTQDQACVNCHTAHGSDLDALMLAQPVELCLNCHAQPVTDAEGQLVASVAEIADPALIKHGPVRDGTCGGCHNVHGSDVSRLLIKPYPETFYASFALEKYELCFTCHDQQLVKLPQTEGLTGFRDGAMNLHYIHVNKAKRGRSCRACHNTHASTLPLHLRETVPYGNWALPINYTRTDTGGSCAPGCHQPLGYDRQNPVNGAAAQETTP